MKVSIVMPAYNEEKRIGRTLEVYSEYFERLKKEGKLDYEFLVVINNTTDRTEEIVLEHMRKNKRIRYLNLKPGGKGFAVLEGFKDALKRENEVIGYVDVDMATSPEEFWRLLREAENNSVVIADRYIKGARVYPPNTFRRLVVSRVFNILIRGLFFMPYRDTQCGAKVLKRRAVEKVLPRLKFSYWAFDVDLIYNLRKSGFRIKCVPTIWVDKEYSKINFWKAGPWMALGVVRLRLWNSPFRNFVKFYDYCLNNFKRGRVKNDNV